MHAEAVPAFYVCTFLVYKFAYWTGLQVPMKVFQGSPLQGCRGGSKFPEGQAKLMQILQPKGMQNPLLLWELFERKNRAGVQVFSEMKPNQSKTIDKSILQSQESIPTPEASPKEVSRQAQDNAKRLTHRVKHGHLRIYRTTRNHKLPLKAIDG